MYGVLLGNGYIRHCVQLDSV